MTTIKRIAIIGNSLPRRCGIATFTTDLQQAIAAAYPQIETAVVAMNDQGRSYDYPATVCRQIDDQRLEDYAAAADFLNAGQFDAISLQHEFGIFGGEAGGHIVELLSRVTMPVVTTLHTVLAAPTSAQRRVLDRVMELSSRVVVMAEKARELMGSVYGVAARKIEVIPHGIPDFAFVESDRAKARLGFAGRSVILTFGLLSPNKGIEVMIEAMPSIIARCPNATYVVLGATHPNLLRAKGEAYRDSLKARVRELGIEDHVIFIDQFVDQATLLSHLSACDVYVTPYLVEAQMTSGTLAYSFGLGKAVVSTPYWHAQELLADGRGILVPFGDSVAIGDAIAGLLTNGDRRRAMGKQAYACSRAMTWERTAARYLATFDSARRSNAVASIGLSDQSLAQSAFHAPPELQLDHFLTLCDDTGILQHAIYAVGNRAHGYCVDDNARALLLACQSAARDQQVPERVTATLASFVQHAWNSETKRFRNFMGYDRRWLEEAGSEDSHGRTLWALGKCAGRAADPALRRWAADLFAEALPSVEPFRSPRAWAFTLLGLDAYCTAVEDTATNRLRRLLADRLMEMLANVETRDWTWFEDKLAYDNARLSQALIAAGIATGEPRYTEAGMRTLRWLMTLQMTPSGIFRPVGTESFGAKFKAPRAFDQQPVEAAATISACLAAWRADGDAAWQASAACAFAWFFGGNDLATPLVDAQTGSCRDGLHPDRPNENRGAESVLSYLLSLAEIRQCAQRGKDAAVDEPTPICA